MSQPFNDRQIIHHLLLEFSTAMLVTHAGGDHLRARPMAIASLSEDCQITFITDRESAKVHEIESDTRVHVVCQKDRSAYLSLQGSARLVTERAELVRVWAEPFRVWFPEGPEDPKAVLIVVNPLEAEYWNNEGTSKVRYLWEAARAYVTGTRPEISAEQHGNVRL